VSEDLRECMHQGLLVPDDLQLQEVLDACEDHGGRLVVMGMFTRCAVTVFHAPIIWKRTKVLIPFPEQPYVVHTCVFNETNECPGHRAEHVYFMDGRYDLTYEAAIMAFKDVQTRALSNLSSHPKPQEVSK